MGKPSKQVPAAAEAALAHWPCPSLKGWGGGEGGLKSVEDLGRIFVKYIMFPCGYIVFVRPWPDV